MPKEFYSLTWNQYCLKCQGSFNKDKREWERVGWSTYRMVAIHAKKGSMPTFKNFMKFIYETPEMEQSKLDHIKNVMNQAMSKYLSEKK